MADILETRTEHSIPHLESMLSSLFGKDHLKIIIGMRKEFEYKMQRSTKRKEDIMEFISFEMKLLKGVRLQHKKKSGLKNDKIQTLEFQLSNQLKKLFLKALGTFSDDLGLWVMFLKFCKQMKLQGEGSRIMKQMLNLHGGKKPELYLYAAKWEIEECNNFPSARLFLLEGINVHPGSRVLIADLFKLELQDADMKRKEMIESKIEINPDNDTMNTKKAEVIYDRSVKKLDDIELLATLIDACAKYDFAANLKKKITEDFFSKQNNERMWDISAKIKLNSALNNIEGSDLKVGISDGIDIYKKAVKKINSFQMWEYYIGAILELMKDDTKYPLFKKNLLLSALEAGAKENKLTEKYYLIWVKELQDSNKKDKSEEVLKVLEHGLRTLNKSAPLWHNLLKIHLQNGDETKAEEVFNKAVAILEGDGLSLWKLMIQYQQTKSNAKVEYYFRKGWMMDNEVAQELQPMFLEWLVLTNSIASAREAYKLMGESKPHCLAMHKKMIYLESIQPNVNRKWIRQPIVKCCELFGETDINVWLEYCNFLRKTSEEKKVVKNVTNAYNDAIQKLKPHLVDSFKCQFELTCNIQIPKTDS